MNPVYATGHFLYPLKTLENLSIPPWKRQKTFGFLMLSWGIEGFSDVFMRDRKGPVAWNGLTFFHLAHFSLICVSTYSKLTLPFLKINKCHPKKGSNSLKQFVKFLPKIILVFSVIIISPKHCISKKQVFSQWSVTKQNQLNLLILNSNLYLKLQIKIKNFWVLIGPN